VIEQGSKIERRRRPADVKWPLAMGIANGYRTGGQRQMEGTGCFRVGGRNPSGVDCQARRYFPTGRPTSQDYPVVAGTYRLTRWTIARRRKNAHLASIFPGAPPISRLKTRLRNFRSVSNGCGHLGDMRNDMLFEANHGTCRVNRHGVR